MQEHNLFTIYTSRLNKLQLNYIVTGSVAGVIYGEPRLTMDVDIKSILKNCTYDIDIDMIKNHIKSIDIRDTFNSLCL